ncbi:MAG: hypothetical protein EAY69_10305 [Cytophagales bacterium]|nr:MAG: hypothetical protein EAY69_10305 [Cytophagales bacterium]
MLPTENKTAITKKKKKRKLLLISYILITLCFLGSVGLYWFHYHFTPYLHSVIENKISQATDNFFVCKIEKFDSKFIQTSFYIYNLTLKKNEEKWKNLTSIQKASINQIAVNIPKLSIIRWYWWEYFFQNKIRLDDIIIEHANVEIQQAWENKKQNFSFKNLFKKAFSIRKIDIKHSNITLNMLNNQKYYLTQKLQKIDANLKNIDFNPDKKEMEMCLFSVNIHEIDLKTLDNKNQILGENITLDNKNLHFERLLFQPTQKNNKDTLAVICKAEEGKINNYNLKKLLKNQILEAESIILPTIFLKIKGKSSYFALNDKESGNHIFDNVALKIKKPIIKSIKNINFEDIEIDWKNYHHLTNDNQYQIYSKKGNIIWKNKTIELENTTIFSKNTTERKNRYLRFFSENININGIDWERLWTKKELFTQNIILQKPIIEAKINENISFNALKNDNNFYFSTNNIIVENGKIHYSQRNNVQKKEEHSIEKINLHFKNIEVKKNKNQNIVLNLNENDFLVECQNYRYDSEQNKIKIDIENGKINAQQKKLNLENIQIIPYQNNELIKQNAQIKKATFEALDVIRLWKKKELYIKNIIIDNPNFDLATLNIGEEKNFNLYETLKSFPFFIQFDNFVLQNGNFTIAQNRGKHILKNMNFTIPSIHIGKATKYNQDSTKAFFYNTNTPLIASLQQYQFREKNEIYELIINNLSTNLYDSTLRTGTILIQPKLSQKDFFKAKYNQKLYAKIIIPEFITNTLNTEKWIFEQTLSLKKLFFLKPSFYFFFDNSKITSTEKVNQNLTEILQTLPVKVDVKDFEIVDGVLKYEEQKNEGKIAKHSIEPFQIVGKDLKITKERNSIDAKKIILKLENYNFYLPDSSYQVGFKYLETQLTDSILSIQKLFIRPLKEKTYTTTWNGNIEKVEILSNDFRKWIFGKEYLIYDLKIEKPDFNGYSTIKDEYNSIRLPNLAKPLTIQNLNCKEGKIKFLQAKKTNYEPLEIPYQIENIEGNIEKIVWINQTNINTCWQNMSVTANNYRSYLDENLLQIDIRKIGFNTKNSTLDLDSVHLKPRFDDHFYTWVKKGRSTSANLKIEKVNLKNIDYSLLKKENTFSASFIRLEKVNTDLFKDKRWGKPTYNRLMLNDLFQLIKTPLKVDSLEITEGYLKYSEQVTKGLEDAGEIFLSNFAVKMKNISNLDTITKTKINAEALVMGEGKLMMEMDIFLNQKILKCEAFGDLSSMSVVHFNQLLEPNYHIRLKKGIIQGAVYQVEMADREAKGVLLAGYKRLRIQFLKPQNHKRKQGIKNFLTNLIIKNRNNMYKKHPKYGEINFKRKHESFWSFLFMSLGSGLIDTIL